MPTDHDLDARVRVLVTSTAALAGELGYADARSEMTALLDGLDALGTTVVVVGEANTGKSSLLNALVGRPELLPTEHLVATNAPVVLRHGTPERVAVWLEGDRDASRAPLDELPRWATVTGFEERRREDTGALPVSAIEVQLDAPQLGELMMVDTPGVGGLVAAHARVTLEALRRADALVFVLQSRSPASDQELDFLEKAAGQVHAVIVVLTKADGPRAGWEAVLAENRRLVGARIGGGRDWPIIPVSALSAVSALEARVEGADAEAAAFDELSGLDRLQTELRTRVEARGRLLRHGRVVQLVGGVLTRCATGIEARRLSLAVDDTSAAARTRLLSAVEAALADDAAWRSVLGSATTDLVQRLEREGARRIEANIDWTYGGPVQQGESTDLPVLLRDLDREVTALHGALHRLYLSQLTTIVRKLQTMLGSEGIEGLLNDLAPPADRSGPLPAVAGARPFDSMMDRDVLLAAGGTAITATGFLTSGGLSTVAAAGGVAAAPAAFASSALAVPVAGGGAAAGGAAGGAAAAVALGPALVVGAFVGVAVLGLRAYQKHKAAQVQRAAQALDRARLAAAEIVHDFRTHAETIDAAGSALVEQRLTERRHELGGGQTVHDTERRAGLVALDGVGAELDRLQDLRADLRATVAARLTD